MLRTGSHLLLALAALTAVSGGITQAADDSHGQDKALREVQGTVTAVSHETETEGGPWLLVTIQDDRGEAFAMRVAPVEVLDGAGFEVAVGDRARAQVFVEDTPHAVARFRNIDHGTTLRLRCLHGEPIWAHPGFASGQQGGPAAGGAGGGAQVRRRGGR